MFFSAFICSHILLFRIVWNILYRRFYQTGVNEGLEDSLTESAFVFLTSTIHQLQVDCGSHSHLGNSLDEHCHTNHQHSESLDGWQTHKSEVADYSASRCIQALRRSSRIA